MKALVTGGGGFLGTEICRQLRERGDEVVSIARGDYPHLRELGVATVRADLADLAAMTRAAEGCDAVFHVAAKAGVWGKRADFFSANVQGTRHVVDACRAAGVPRLVHTSSPSVCFDGTEHVDAGNDLPLASAFLAHYPESKAEAERIVLAANDGGLAVCALRPHLIFGPGDPHLLPRVVAAARAGKLARVGDGTNEVTLCFVENAATAHLSAADALAPGTAPAGRAYFIGQEEPVRLWEWIDDLLRRLGVAPVGRSLSLGSAYRIGAVLETLYTWLPLPGEPRMTRFVATQLATSHSYSMTPAREDFGYGERVGLPEATERTARWLAETC